MYGAYMEDIKYVNMIEIGPVVIEIWGVENGELAVPVNNTLVRHTAFLATDTWPCVLIIYCNFLLFIWLRILLFVTKAYILWNQN